MFFFFFGDKGKPECARGGEAVVPGGKPEYPGKNSTWGETGVPGVNRSTRAKTSQSIENKKTKPTYSVTCALTNPAANYKSHSIGRCLTYFSAISSQSLN